MTLGEYKVGITFNPSGDENVNAIKQKAAELIDLIDAVRRTSKAAPNTGYRGEIERLCALAMTHVEDAAMWGVKAATKGPMS